jgi:magnesium transporter
MHPGADMKKKARRTRYQPGLAPGTIQERAPEEAVELQVSIIDYTPERIDIDEDVPIARVRHGDQDVNRWIRIRGTPTMELLRAIGTEFGVHNLILEDIIGSGQRIKVEDYDNLKFTVLRSLTEGASDYEDETDISMILTSNTIITIYEADDVGYFAPILERLRNRGSLLRHHRVDFLFHAIVDLVVDRFFPLVQRMEERATQLETEILERASEEQLRSIHVLRSNSQQARRILWAIRDVVSRIERSANRFIESDTLFYFRDIHDHVVHLLEAISTLRDTANGLMELYMSGVSNRMNEVMKVLTIISTLFIPGTFIAGVYGMNFRHMPELSVPWAYPLVLGVMSAVAIGMLIFFKRRRWF